MQSYKKPHTTFLDHLTKDNYFLNEKCNELYKINGILQKNIEYLNGFVFSTYELSGSYISNIKIISYDSSDNVISYICSDSSGNFSPQNKIDLSKNFLNNYHLKNTMKNTESHISDTSRSFPFHGGYGHCGGYGHYGGYGHCGGYGFPYYPLYGYGYPYGNPYLYGSKDDDDNREIHHDLSLNIPNNIQPINVPFPNTLPIMHRDMMDHSTMHRDFELNHNQIHPMHHYFKNHHK